MSLLPARYYYYIMKRNWLEICFIKYFYIAEREHDSILEMSS